MYFLKEDLLLDLKDLQELGQAEVLGGGGVCWASAPRMS